MGEFPISEEEAMKKGGGWVCSDDVERMSRQIARAVYGDNAVLAERVLLCDIVSDVVKRVTESRELLGRCYGVLEIVKYSHHLPMTSPSAEAVTDMLSRLADARDAEPNAFDPVRDGGHVEMKCKPSCETPGCMFCQGGLFACKVCGALEGAVPTNCPGRSMTSAEIDEVYAGRLDYRDGTWQNRPSNIWEGHPTKGCAT